MPKPKVGGYAFRRSLAAAQREAQETRKRIEQALKAQGPREQAVALTLAVLSLGRIEDSLAEMQQILGPGRRDTDPRAPIKSGH